MAGRRFLITGASRGIGFATAQQMANNGDVPIGLARTQPDDFPGEFFPVDLSDRSSTSRHSIRFSLPALSTAYSTTSASLDLETLARSTLTIGQTFKTSPSAQPSKPFRRQCQEWSSASGAASSISRALCRSEESSDDRHMVPPKPRWSISPACGHSNLPNTASPSTTLRQAQSAPNCSGENNPPGSPGEARYLSMVPLGKLGTVEDISSAVCFLMSESAGWITGQTLRVDGGSSIGAASLF